MAIAGDTGLFDKYPGVVEAHCCITCWRENRPQIHGHPFRVMIVCPDCGNKRCPKATFHGLACTGSNAPGQPGSVYL
jgi:DNA-directed RNA polymerase subunit RPC12/RpoP